MNELDHVSHSQLSQWSRCPRQWESRYIHGVFGPASDSLILGSCYHEGLEQNFKFKLRTGEDLDFDILYDVYCTAWEEYKNKNEILWQKNTEGDAKDLGLLLLEKYITDVAPDIMPQLVEQWYNTYIGDTKFVLRLDLLDVNGAVIDHKTSGRRYAESDVHRDPQASATAFVLGKPIVFYNHVAIKTQNPYIQIVKSARNNADIAWWLKWATGIINHMKSGYAPPNDSGWWCGPKYCNIYDDCMKDLTRTIYT